MPNRDYAVRTKPKKSGNKFLIIIIIFLLLLLSMLGLWVLNNMQVNTNQQPATQIQQKQKTKTALPSPPEEIYSYIRDLETREIPVDPNSKLARLTKEQQLLRQKAEERRRLEQQGNAGQGFPLVNEPQLTEQAIQEQRLAEEKQKQELAKRAEKERLEALKQIQDKPSAKMVVRAPADAPKSAGRFGLQCGAFKNKAQAENMQARLAMSGYNARINSSGEWNRVVVGPIGDRAATSVAQSNARNVAECVIISM
ncbi:MAG: cell division protein FtsN [Pasteurellaceae bacterium]|nr:cell division protein FtsN [Pasteurellaceae bacterium]